MPKRNPKGGLTDEEKRVVKALLNEQWRNQDIQALINEGRSATVNSARITGVKQNATVVPADQNEVAFFKLKKKSYDPITGFGIPFGGLGKLLDGKIAAVRQCFPP